jgi:hypothetical protein
VSNKKNYRVEIIAIGGYFNSEYKLAMKAAWQSAGCCQKYAKTKIEGTLLGIPSTSHPDQDKAQ